MITNWKGKRVTVMGLGRFSGGVGVTRWLVRQGAVVTVTDRAPPERLDASLADIRDLDVRLRLGGHDHADFREADLVVVNPAVPDTSAFLEAARSAGTPITTEINLFVERCPARCVGVTGSVGKSTVTSMIGHVLEHAARPQRAGRGASADDVRAAPRRVWVGGNIGRSLLGALDEISADDVVVLELSSFQLQRTPAAAWSPHVAVITDVTPNHLDWHGDFDAYVAAKLNIARFQRPGRDAIVLFDAPGLYRAVRDLPAAGGGVWRYRLDGRTPCAEWVDRLEAGAAEDARRQCLRWPDIRLGVPGRHNRENAAAALTVAHILGVADEAAVGALQTFEALPHRLQKVGQLDGVAYYDDSKSTTPEAAMTALDAFAEPILVILGGYDKGSDLRPLAEVAARRTRFAACIGVTGRGLAEAIADRGGHAEYVGDLTAAVAACRSRARPGDVILLSPACASWDQFIDYRARGLAFAQLALASGGAAP